MILGNLEIRATLDHHWKFTGVDMDKSHEIYCDDVLVEFPQSGEKIRGLPNLIEYLGNIIQVNLTLRIRSHSW